MSWLRENDLRDSAHSGLRVMDMSEFDVIFGMDWLTAYRVVIDCERRRVTSCTQDGTRVTFQRGQA